MESDDKREVAARGALQRIGGADVCPVRETLRARQKVPRKEDADLERFPSVYWMLLQESLFDAVVGCVVSATGGAEADAWHQFLLSIRRNLEERGGRTQP